MKTNLFLDQPVHEGLTGGADQHRLRQMSFGPAVDVYRHETHELIRRFFEHRLTFPQCLFALDSALGDLATRVNGEQIASLEAFNSANYETVMEEMERRISLDRTTRPYST